MLKLIWAAVQCIFWLAVCFLGMYLCKWSFRRSKWPTGIIGVEALLLGPIFHMGESAFEGGMKLFLYGLAAVGALSLLILLFKTGLYVFLTVLGAGLIGVSWYFMVPYILQCVLLFIAAGVVYSLDQQSKVKKKWAYVPVRVIEQGCEAYTTYVEKEIPEDDEPEMHGGTVYIDHEYE